MASSIAANSESRISVNSFSLPKLPPLKYFSRRSSNIRTNDLPLEEGAIGAWSLWGVIYTLTFATIPLAYVYILLILFREVCRAFPETLLEPLLQAAAQQEGFVLPKLVYFMETHSSRWVELWCIVEGVFFVVLKLQIQYLQCKDTLEASLSAAPLMDMHERAILWDRMMDATEPNTVSFLCGWFFDCQLEEISKYDIRDFCTWCMFESRHQEHLTSEETEQLQEFIEDFEYRISVLLYGVDDEDETPEGDDVNDDDSFSSLGLGSAKDEPQKLSTLPRRHRPPPTRWFRFPESTSDEEPTFFTNLYENYKRRYEQYTLGTAHPVQGFRNFVAEAEENALATASQMYHSVVTPEMDKQLTAYTHATKVQLQEAWDSCRKDRLEMADFVSNRSNQIQQQLKGYRTLLHRMIRENARVPTQQMAHIMRKITQCNEAMERVEKNAMDGFGKAMGFARRNLPTVRLPTASMRREPARFAKYNIDPLLGIETYPLGFHLLVLCGTELPLRVMMRNRGFRRLRVGRVHYYFHPGRQELMRGNTHRGDDRSETGRLPIIFVHGIGVGLIAYVGLIDRFLDSGRPILLPEIPYVSGFRPWQSPNAVLPPAVVTSTMIDMMATHGFLRGTFVGHSYGTSWLSYMVKYAPQAVAAVCFLDPICFGLHYPRLTKQFVYVRPDPGSISFMVRTDIIVNWTIQRSFPWAWIILFVEQIQNIPCSVFLSDGDMLVPAAKVEEYMRNNSFPVRDFEMANASHFSDKADINVTVFRGDYHGGWTERPGVTSPKIAQCVEILTSRAEQMKES